MLYRLARTSWTGRILAVGIAATVLLTACSSSGSSGTTPVAAESSSSSPTGSPGATAVTVGSVKDLQPMSAFCGTKDVTVAYVDSNASVNSWRKITKAEFVDEASKCSHIKHIIYTDGQGSLQKTISDMNGVIAQHVDLIVTSFGDFGAQLLPVMRKAMSAGIPVAATLGGPTINEMGKAYVANVYADEAHDAGVRVAWLNKVLGGKGNIIDVGGTPGNPLSLAAFAGVKEYLSSNPGLTLLNTTAPIDTNFNAADEQKAVAGALAKYSQIDGVQNECGTCAPGGFRAFQAAGRPLVAWTSDDNNEVACDYYDLKKTNPNFQIMTTAARNWLVRVALHAAMAKAEGLPDTEPQVYGMPIVEDSTNPALQPKCVKDAPPGAIFSSLLTQQQVIDAVK